MRTEHARLAVHEVLTEEGFTRSPARCEGSLRYEGDLRVAGRVITVAIEFPCLAFSVLPRVILLDRAAQLPGVVAHIEEGDRVCYAAPGSVVPDMYNPAGSALLVLLLAERTLAACISGEADRDVSAEFSQHWNGPTFLTALGADAPDGPARLVSVWRKGKLQTSVLVRGDTGLEWFQSAPGRDKDKYSEPAFVLNLGVQLDLPGAMLPPTNLAELLVWVQRLKAGSETRLAAAIRHKSFHNHKTTLFFPARNGCVGVRLEPTAVRSGQGFRACFVAEQSLVHPHTVQVSRLSGQRIDRDFMFSRNLGGMPSLSGRRIVLVGCGTIGSHLARLLVQGGAGQRRPGSLTLIDNQVLWASNIGRHLLPPRYIGASKADALADELTRQFPGLDIRAIADSAMDQFEKLTASELVIDATGEEALSIALNSRLVGLRPLAPDALYVRLFGDGAAAQSFFVQGSAAGLSCFKCLRPALNAAPIHLPISPDAELTFMPAACGEGAFQPFGVAAPVIAAGLASRMCMEWAAGSVEPTLRTFRIDQATTVHVPDCSPLAVRECPCCGPVSDLRL